MIRRDYILRMIEQFIQALARIKSLKQAQTWDSASGCVDEEFQRLMGLDARAIAVLSETELLARLIQGEPTSAVTEKTLIIATLLKEAGDVANASGFVVQGRSYYLQGLHLLLGTLARHEIIELPGFVPRVELFVAALADAVLPAETHARLMQHYERNGEFGKAEDALFSLFDLDPQNPALLEFGISFYQRLETLANTALEEGNLPRPEVESALAELRSRKGVPTPPTRT